MALQNTTLTTSPASIVTSTGNTGVTTTYICNYSSGAVTVYVWAVPSGGSAGLTTIIYNGVIIAAGDTLVIDNEKLILGNGDALYANANAASSAVATVSTLAI